MAPRKSRAGRSFSATLLAVAIYACGNLVPQFKEPPAGSFASETHQVKIGESTAPLAGASVTKDFFPGTNAQPLLGRFFVGADFAPAGTSTVILSHQLWNARLGASPAIIGQQIEIEGRPYVVVGVAPRGFEFPSGAQFWTPRKP
ncbi:MAG TPA: ABC transporter permease [Vicinamibacterales bacterium]|nr:ABC transporter permease [Vicinamibacterales bacterium]